jgi:hypothetical protein
MATALHPPGQMTFKLGDEILPRAWLSENPRRPNSVSEPEIRDLDDHQRLQGWFLEERGYNSFAGAEGGE